MVIWKFQLDSVLINDLYKPEERAYMDKGLFIDKFDFLNDSVIVGKAVHVLNNSTVEMTMLKHNLNSNYTEKWGYEHPCAVGKNQVLFLHYQPGTIFM